MDFNYYLILFGVIFLGIISGTITGLIPGIHNNMVAMFLLVNISFLYLFLDLNFIIIFIITMGVIHSFIDFIPSIIFGVTDVDTSLSMLPTHRLVLNGEGYTAIFLSAIGSLFGMFFSFLLAPFFYFFLETFYSIIKNFIWIVLVLVIILLIFLEDDFNKKFWAFFIVICSGSFGFLVLNSNLLVSPLLVLFSGIFGVSTLINALLEKTSSLPEQDFNIDFKFDFPFFRSIFIGGISAGICSITPGIGNSQAATISSLFFKNISSKLFIVTISAINTVNFILSFLTFYLISKSRNGSVFVISQIVSKITFNDILFYFLIIFIVSIVGFFLTLFLGKRIIKFVFRLNFQYINLSVLVLLFLLVYLISGLYGVFVMIGASSLGLFVILIGISRIHLMSILLIPVIFNLI